MLCHSRFYRTAIVRRTGPVCAAWLIAAAGAGQAMAEGQKGSSKASGATAAAPAARAPSKGAKAPKPAARITLPAADGESAGESEDAGRDPFGSPAGPKADITVTDYLTVDLHVQDEDLANVLQMLSLQSQKNIVVSKDVSATVNANLYNVTIYEALDAILNVNGYGYIEKGNFIFVYTLDEIARIEQANRKPISKVVRLNYLNANDAAEFVAPLLSEIGQIKTNGDAEKFTLTEKTPQGDETFALTATLVVIDYPEHVEEIEKLVQQLDTRPSQVLVEATILQTQLSEANAFGIDFSIIGDINFTDFITAGGPLGVANALVKGGTGGSGQGVSPADNSAQGATSSPGNTTGPSTFKLGIIDDDFAVFLRLLDEVTDVSILSNPKILALNRQPARVLVGQRLGYLNTTSTETSTTQTVEFLDTGTQLAFRPFISNDGMIRMELSPSVSEGVIRSATDVTGANVSIPDEITQELTTNVLVRDGSTIVLGGLFKETTTLTRRQVPVVGDIPILGAAFRGHEDETKRSEIIFMIKPTIMNDQSLIEDGERAIAYGERIRTGTRSALLPFSRERMTAQLNVEAEKLARDGKTEEALWNVRRSLELNPNQPDAISIREGLLNEREFWPSRSLLERVIDKDALDAMSQAGTRSRFEFVGPPEPTAEMLAQSAQPTESGAFMGPMPQSGASQGATAFNDERSQDEFVGNPFASDRQEWSPSPMAAGAPWALPFWAGNPLLFIMEEPDALAFGPDQGDETETADPAFTGLWRMLRGMTGEEEAQAQPDFFTDAQDEPQDDR